MVFSGQDAWRKHPLIYGCWKRPLPGLGTAIGIFSIYLFLDYVQGISAPKEIPKVLKANISYSYDPEGLDKAPIAHSKGGHHGHH